MSQIQKLDIAGPLWEDNCHHGEDCYMGSWKIPTSVPGEQPQLVDVYIYYGTHAAACIRYSDEYSGYYGPGPVADGLREESIFSELLWKVLGREQTKPSPTE